MSPANSPALWLGPLAVIAVSNMGAVVLCAWPVPASLLKNIAMSRAAESNHPSAPTGHETQWYESEAWLDGLNDTGRRQAIKALRAFESWIREKPESFQSRLMALNSREREELITRTRQREQEGPLSGLIHPSVASEAWLEEAREFLSIKLLPRLDESELMELEKAASGEKKTWLTCFARLAHDHIHLPQGPTSVTGIKNLPPHWKKSFEKLDPTSRKRLEALEGRWPDFAIALYSSVIEARQSVPAEALGPCRWEEMPGPWIAALQPKGFPSLANLERNKLQSYEGQWPAYPRQVLESLRRRAVSLPTIRLPGPALVWRQAFDSR